MIKRVLWLVVVLSLLTTFPLVSFATQSIIPVQAQGPATFEVSSLEIEPEEVNVGETVRIRCLLSNKGENEGSYTVNFKINGKVEHTNTATLLGSKVNAKATWVTYVTSMDKPGTYQVEVEGLTGSFNVVGEAAQSGLWWQILLGVVIVVVIALLVVWQIKRRRAAASK